MDGISLLPDELLLRILSLVPTKHVVATSVLSTRWKSLWKMVPKLDFDYETHNTKHGTLSEIVYRSLHLHKAPVLDSLHLQLDSTCAPVDIGIWVGIAVDRRVRELEIDPDYSFDYNESIRLPSSLYICETLETLILRLQILVDVPSLACFKSLKTLHLILVDYKEDESFCRLLSSCPVLENLVVKRTMDKVFTFTIAVPSLKRLSVWNDSRGWGEFVINAPSLKYLTIFDYFDYDFFLIENMPEVVEANIQVESLPTEKFLGSVTSAKRLSLSLSPLVVPYPTGCIFYRLLHLELFTKDAECLSLLMCLLEHSPKLQVLKLKNPDVKCYKDPLACWNQPSSVPECLSFHLETFKWGRYKGKRQEKEVTAYILTNASRLQRATVSSKSTNVEKKHRMLKELASVARGSTACQLIFD